MTTKKIFFTVAAYALTYIIVVLVFRLAATKVYAKLDLTRLDTTQQLLHQGNLTAADRELKELESSQTAPTEKVQQQRVVWQQLQDDLLFAKDYYQNNGNSAKAEAVSRVLASYATPKEMLSAVQLLLKQGEIEYARKLYDRVGRLAPDYVGYQALQPFLTP